MNSHLVSRIAATARTAASAITLAWLALSLVTFAARPSPPLAAFFMSGAFALLAALYIMLSALLLCWWPERARPVTAREAWRPLLACVIGAGVAIFPLRLALRPLVPADLAYREPIAFVAALYAALALAIVTSWLVGRARRRALPLWPLLPLPFLARLVATPALELFAPGRETLVDAGSLAVASILARDGVLALEALAPSLLRALIPLALVSALGCVALVGGHAVARAALVDHHPSAAGVLVALRRLFDGDGDGASPWLAGSDCDDANPNVSPDAIEIVGNGVDDNCLGGDLARAPAPPAARRDPTFDPRSIVLVTIDTVRADRVDPKHMPELSRVAAQGAVFTRAYAAAPYTAGSLKSLMSGQLPNASAIAYADDLGHEPFLAEVLSAAGFSTACVNHPFGTARWVLEEGFARVSHVGTSSDDLYRGVFGPAITRASLRELERMMAAKQPFFVWIHYLDAHAEYMPRANTPFSSLTTTAGRYDQEVWATDHELGRILAYLEGVRFFERGVLVVHSDHGELLDEQGRTGHALWLDEQVLQSVLVLRGAGIPVRRIDTRVRLYDVYPTLLELAAGVRAPSAGESLARTWGEAARDRDVFAYTRYPGAWQRAAISGPYKLHEDLLHGADHLYDLAQDPQETNNLIEAQPAIAAALRAKLGAAWDRALNDAVLRRRAQAIVRRACSRGDAAACAALQRSGAR